jgi:hypothetical protein
MDRYTKLINILDNSVDCVFFLSFVIQYTLELNRLNCDISLFFINHIILHFKTIQPNFFTIVANVVQLSKI